MRRKGTSRTTSSDSWLEDLALFSLPLFKHLILAMRAIDLSPDVLESCLMYFQRNTSQVFHASIESHHPRR